MHPNQRKKLFLVRNNVFFPSPKDKRSPVKAKFIDVKEVDPEEEIDGDTFQRAVWPVLAVAQVFGLMPVQSISSSNPHRMSFEWRSLRTLQACMYVFYGGSIVVASLRAVIKNDGVVTPKNIVGTVFFSVCTYCIFLFLLLAKRWKSMAVMWTNSERVFLNASYKCRGWTLASKVRVTALVMLLLALLEHGFFLMSATYNYLQKKKNCSFEITSDFKQFFLIEYGFIFDIIPYNLPIGIWVWWMNFTLTFCWNYMDIFIVAISIGLVTRFSQINHRLETMYEKAIPSVVWHEVRMHYVQICELLEFVDENLATIIILACANDLYFICIQLLNIFNKLPYLINRIYFWYSLLFLIGRTLCLFLFASAINDASSKPLECIRSMPTNVWCSDIERFSEQLISSQVVALSGMKFFHLTRKILFGMGGSIVTYELVLMQFDSATAKPANETMPVCQLTPD